MSSSKRAATCAPPEGNGTAYNEGSFGLRRSMSAGCIEVLDFIPPVMPVADAVDWEFPTLLQYDIYNAVSGQPIVRVCLDFEHTVRDVECFLEEFALLPLQIVSPLPQYRSQALPTLCARSSVHSIGVVISR